MCSGIIFSQSFLQKFDHVSPGDPFSLIQYLNIENLNILISVFN